MKNLKIMLAAAALLALWLVPAWAQDDVMFLNDASLGPHQRPLVKFTHAKHATNIKCVTCHHNFDQYSNLLDDSEGVSCSECHKAAPTAKNRVGLLLAFHQGCKGCHEQAIEKGQRSGPVMCGDCHDRQAYEGYLAAQAKKAKK